MPLELCRVYGVPCGAAIFGGAVAEAFGGDVLIGAMIGCVVGCAVVLGFIVHGRSSDDDA